MDNICPRSDFLRNPTRKGKRVQFGTPENNFHRIRAFSTMYEIRHKYIETVVPMNLVTNYGKSASSLVSVKQANSPKRSGTDLSIYSWRVPITVVGPL